jgi:hypothetical protein
VLAALDGTLPSMPRHSPGSRPGRPLPRALLGPKLGVNFLCSYETRLPHDQNFNHTQLNNHWSESTQKWLGSRLVVDAHAPTCLVRIPHLQSPPESLELFSILRVVQSSSLTLARTQAKCLGKSCSKYTTEQKGRATIF